MVTNLRKSCLLALVLLAGQVSARASIAYNTASSDSDAAGNLYVTYVATTPAGYAVKTSKRLAGTKKISWTETASIGNASSPGGIGVDSAGDSFVGINDVGAAATALLKYDANGVLISSQTTPFQGPAFSPLIAAVAVDKAGSHLYAALNFVDPNHNGLTSILLLSYDLGFNVQKTQLINDGPSIADEANGFRVDGAGNLTVGITEHVSGNPNPSYQVARFSPGLGQLLSRVSTSTAVDAICIDCTNIQISGGDGQQGPTGSTLPTPLSVLVTFPFDGSPVSQLGVFYSVTSAPTGATGQSLAAEPGFTLMDFGGGPFVLTDVNGMASEVLTLGNQPGGYQVQAIPFGNVNNFVVFNETAVSALSLQLALNPTQVNPLGTVTLPVGTSVTTIEVTALNGNSPAIGQMINFRAESMPTSGGHDHRAVDLTAYPRPVGRFGPNLSATGSCTTDSLGRCTIAYRASQMGGQEIIVASASGAEARQTLLVRVPLLEALGTGAEWTLVGDTGIISPSPKIPQSCQNQPITHHENHFAFPFVNARLIDAISDYNDRLEDLGLTRQILQINDMSLPNGGRFDICANWVAPHGLHKEGLSVDINRRATNGSLVQKKILEKAMTHQFAHKVNEGPIHYEFSH